MNPKNDNPTQHDPFSHPLKRRFLPHAFTENGAVMATNVLNSPQAVRMSAF